MAGLGCASMNVAGPATATSADVGAAEGGGEQALYRLIHDGGEGRTSLKVVLRRALGPRFQLVFSDVAGRRVWSLDHSPEAVTLVDHRAGVYCIEGPDLRLPEVHPQELPLAVIPRVLAGLLPVDPGPDSEDGEFVDPAGRRWRASSDGGKLMAWSLLDGGGPSLWWTRDREGGILSQRGGVQYRWQLIVREASSEPLRDIVPAGFDKGTCGD